jgi:hypothetical protein
MESRIGAGGCGKALDGNLPTCCVRGRGDDSITELGTVLHGYGLDGCSFGCGIRDGSGAPEGGENEGESDKLEVHDYCGECWRGKSMHLQDCLVQTWGCEVVFITETGVHIMTLGYLIFHLGRDLKNKYAYSLRASAFRELIVLLVLPLQG